MIQFDTDLSDVKHLWVFNNNIIEFYDDSPETSLYCDLTTEYFNVRLYPNPEGKFYFNFKEYLKSIAINNNLEDSVVSSIDNTIESLVYDDTDDTLIELNVDFSIELEGAAAVTLENINYNFFVGVEQLDEYQRQELHQIDFFLMHKLLARSQKDYYINYWPGYPFDFNIYSSSVGDMNILNQTNALDIDLPLASKVNRIVFSDVSTNETIENHLPLIFGFNKLQLTQAAETPIDLIINKKEASCGVYVKFRNNQGGWSYWLFDKQNQLNRSVSDYEDINNDYSNIENTTAPLIKSGKSKSNDSNAVYASKISNIDLDYLSGIIESPKVYLFTGEAFSVYNTSQWIEIGVKIQSMVVNNTKKRKYNISLELELPERNTITLR